jgi:hypothetical protein
MHCLPYDDVRTNIQGVKEIQIAGMWFGYTTQVRYVREACERKLSAYGKRATAAASAGGIDWKAVSHAVRVSAELLDLMRHGEIKFPLPYSDQILAVKLGQVPLEKVQDVLDGLLDEVEVITAASSLPEEVDRNFWNDWLANETQEALFPEVWMYNRLCK